MEEKRSFNKSLMVVSLLLLSVVVILIALFVLRPTEERDGIVLPTQMTEIPQEPVAQTPVMEGFLQIDCDTIVDVLDTMVRPAYYYQSYSVMLGSGRSTSAKQVALWVSDGVVHAEVRDDKMVKSVLTDGTTAWIWYEQDLNPVSVVLNETLLLEDLIGIPNFDYQTDMAQANRLDCGYAVDEETQQQYLFVQTDDAEDTGSEYRFSLDSGLMYSCRIMSEDTLVYEVLETDFDRLAPGDQAYDGRLCLPDGSVPFTAGTRMLLP